MRRHILLFTGLFLAATGISRLDASPALESTFAPLDRWQAAVAKGDEAGLKALYSADDTALATTPQGTVTDPHEEPEFWATQASAGLTAIETKILQQTSRPPGTVSLVLRVELTFKTKGETRRSFVSMAQVWVERDEKWRILITNRSGLEPLPVFRLPQPKVPDTHLYPDPSEAQKDLETALAAAKIDHKRVLVIFGANWCYDCHVLDAAIRSSQLAPLVAANYHLVHINIGEGKDNADLAQRYQVPLNKGIPSLAVLDGDGQLITSQKQGEFQASEQIGMDDVSHFLERWKPPIAK